MEWLSVLTAVLLAVLSAFIGYGLSLWRNRVRPWIGVRGFGWTRQEDEAAVIPKAVTDLEWESWFARGLPREPTLGTILLIATTAQAYLTETEKSDQALAQAMDELNGEPTSDVVIAVLSALFLDDGVVQSLPTAVDFNLVEIKEPDAAPPRVPIFVGEDEEGEFVALDFPTQQIRFAVSSEPLRDKMLAVAGLVSALDVTALLELLSSLRSVVGKQRDYAHRLLSATQTIVDSRSRFLCDFVVTNFGATPFIVSADHVTMLVNREQQTDRLECTLLLANEEAGLVPAQSVTVIAAGESQAFCAAARSAVEDLESGMELKGAFEKGNRTASILIETMGREFSKFRSRGSSPSPFNLR